MRTVVKSEIAVVLLVFQAALSQAAAMHQALEHWNFAEPLVTKFTFN